MRWLNKLLGQDKQPAAGSNSSATMHRSSDGVYVLRISGVLNKTTVNKVQAIGARDFERGVTDLKLLLVLTDFRGWRQSDDWGDIDFFVQHEKEIAKIAVVGDECWEEETLMFLASGHRTGEVRYFSPGAEEKARAWLVR